MKDNATHINKNVDFREISSPIGICKKFFILYIKTKERNERTIKRATFISAKFLAFLKDLIE
jgi:hypothetical protein